MLHALEPHDQSIKSVNIMFRAFQLRHTQTNLKLMKQHLAHLGYAIVIHKLRSGAYGLPQRRVRLYIFGRRDSKFMVGSKEESLEKIASRLLAFQKESPPVAAVFAMAVIDGSTACWARPQISIDTHSKKRFLHPDGHERLVAELGRLRKKSREHNVADGQSTSSKSERWREVHSSMAENRVRHTLLRCSFELGKLSCHC